MKKLYILDASGYIYRSYFAIRNITNSRGESTNALYGFLRSLLKLRKDFHPQHLVAIFDGPKSIQKRKEIYAEYKAHRTATPPDLIYQISWAQKACELLGIPFLSVSGVEADDTMGSVAVWAAKKGAQVFLCTSDKDLYQLVDDNIAILNTFKENLILGPREVEEVFGVMPQQMIDYLAMTGDASDNVPGIPGIGPKTASALLKQYGSLDYILQNPQVLPGKKQEAITLHANQALMSRQLVTIHADVEFPKEEQFFTIRTPEPAPLKEFYASMNFNSLIREMEQPDKPFLGVEEAPTINETQPTEAVSYSLVDDPIAFDKLIKYLSLQKEIFISVKGSHSQPIKAELIGIGFCTHPGTAWYLPANGKLGLKHISEQLKALFGNPNIHFCGHQIKYDLQVLANYGIEIGTISFDTMLASYLLNSHQRQHSLEHLTLDLFGKVKPSLAAVLGKGKTAIVLASAEPSSLVPLFCEDADDICRIKKILEKQLHERKLDPLFNNLEMPLIPVLAGMERHGMYLDIPYLHRMAKEVQLEIKALEQQIYALAGEEFNLNSPKQLSVILFEKLAIRPPRKTATGLSTDADVLESLKDQYPIAGKILEYRTLEKLRSTYIESLPAEVYEKTGHIHCTFNQTVTATGRLSCQDPNLQNIPIRNEIGRKIRHAFRPENAHWSYLAADYSQIELRLLAHFCEDPDMMHAFNTGEDIHKHTASHIFNVPVEEVTSEQRHNAKAVNFGIIYGQQAYGLSQNLGIEMKEASAFIERYFQRFGKVKQFVEGCKEKARQTGRAVTHTGRERLIPEIHSKNGQIRAAAERLAINTPLQGTAADLIKLAMLQITERLKVEKLKGFMVLQIHDELIFELPDEEIDKMQKLVRDTMQNVLKFKVPIVVDITIGKNWAEC